MIPIQARSLLFTLFGDLIMPHGRSVWIGSLIQMLAEFGLSPEAARVALSRMAQQGWLSTRRVGRRSYYALTEKGHNRIASGARRVYQQPEPWDGQWRILAYTIPEEQRSLRDHLRHELTWLGFAPLSAGTWITPRPIDQQALEILEGLSEWTEIFTARYNGGKGDQALVRRCWNVDAIAGGYREWAGTYRAKLSDLKARMAGGSPPAENWCFVERTLLVHDYRKFLHVDPGLPRELLPADWPGDDAAAVFREYHRLLSTGAERFFTAIYETIPN